MAEQLEEAVSVVLRLDFKDADGISERSKLNQVWKTLGIKPDALIDPIVPSAGEYLFKVFWELWDKTIGISWQSIYYYQLVNDIELTGEDLHVLRRMSNIAQTWVAKKEKASKAHSKPKSAHSGSARKRR